MAKRKKLYIVELPEFKEMFVYNTLAKADANHNLGTSIHTLYRFPFDDMDFENEKCVIKKRWAK